MSCNIWTTYCFRYTLRNLRLIGKCLTYSKSSEWKRLSLPVQLLMHKKRYHILVLILLRIEMHKTLIWTFVPCIAKAPHFLYWTNSFDLIEVNQFQWIGKNFEQIEIVSLCYNAHVHHQPSITTINTILY